MPTVRRARTGVSFDVELIRSMDAHAKKLEDFGVTRSEIVNAIVADFFEGNDTTEAVWDVVSRRRVKRRR